MMNEKLIQKNKTKELFNKIVDGVENVFNSDEYINFLKFVKHLHHYSFNNIMLIYSQMETATYVAGFKKWESFGRKVKKGARGIQIIYPIKQSYKQKEKANNTDLTDNENKVDDAEKIVEYFTYRPTYVFDISQTEGEPMFIEDKSLNSDNMEDFFEFLKTFSTYPILEKELSRYYERILE